MLREERDIRETKEYADPCVMLLGGFDGLHIGHRELIRSAEGYGLSIGVMTIKGGKGMSLFTMEERAAMFREQGLSFYYPVAFTDEVRNTTKEKFMRDLLCRFNAKAFVCGEDFRFGRGAEGTPEFIREYTGIPVCVHPILYVGGKKVSTSGIKDFVGQGDMPAANRLLLHPFFLRGTVEEGRHTGRSLGFPTANLTYPAEKFPMREGVYAIHADLEGQVCRGIANFGPCPTFDVTFRKAEAYFDGYEGNLYGRQIDLCFDAYIRPVCKFGNGEALAEQLRRDISTMRALTEAEKTNG